LANFRSKSRGHVTLKGIKDLAKRFRAPLFGCAVSRHMAHSEALRAKPALVLPLGFGKIGRRLQSKMAGIKVSESAKVFLSRHLLLHASETQEMVSPKVWTLNMTNLGLRLERQNSQPVTQIGSLVAGGASEIGYRNHESGI